MRFHEHFQDLEYNNYTSRFAVHLLGNQHSIGPINEIMEILYITNRDRSMDTFEKFYPYMETFKKDQINEKNTHTVKPNAIFDVIKSYNPP